MGTYYKLSTSIPVTSVCGHAGTEIKQRIVVEAYSKKTDSRASLVSSSNSDGPISTNKADRDLVQVATPLPLSLHLFTSALALLLSWPWHFGAEEEEEKSHRLVSPHLLASGLAGLSSGDEVQDEGKSPSTSWWCCWCDDPGFGSNGQRQVQWSTDGN